MVVVVQSDEFRRWLASLRDRTGRGRIIVRLERLANGNPGDVKPIGDGLSELRIPFGPGYRIYFLSVDETVVVVLGGGDKSTQASDIARAKAVARGWRGL